MLPGRRRDVGTSLKEVSSSVPAGLRSDREQPGPVDACGHNPHSGAVRPAGRYTHRGAVGVPSHPGYSPGYRGIGLRDAHRPSAELDVARDLLRALPDSLDRHQRHLHLQPHRGYRTLRHHQGLARWCEQRPPGTGGPHRLRFRRSSRSDGRLRHAGRHYGRPDGGARLRTLLRRGAGSSGEHGPCRLRGIRHPDPDGRSRLGPRPDGSLPDGRAPDAVSGSDHPWHARNGDGRLQADARGVAGRRGERHSVRPHAVSRLEPPRPRARRPPCGSDHGSGCHRFDGCLESLQRVALRARAPFGRQGELRYPPLGRTLYSWSPFIIIVALFLIVQIPPIKDAVSATQTAINFPSAEISDTTGLPVVPWPGLNGHIEQTAPVVPKPTPYDAVFSTNWLSAAGTIILIGDIIALAFLRVGPGRALRIYGESLNQLKWA